MGDLFGFAQSVVSIGVRAFHLVLRHVAWYLCGAVTSCGFWGQSENVVGSTGDLDGSQPPFDNQ